MPKSASVRSAKSKRLSLKIDSKKKTNQSMDALLNELHQLRQEKLFYKTQLEIYEKLNTEGKKELKNVHDDLNKLKAEELADSRLLQQVSRRLIDEANVDRLYGLIIDAAKTIMQSDAVSMQLYIAERRVLKLLAWQGFHPSAAKFWQWINIVDGSICSAAMTEQKRIVVPDIESCDFLRNNENLKFYRLSKIRSVQSTPLISRSGELLGMLSTHWNKKHIPSERDFALLDIIIRQAADLLGQVCARTALRENKIWLNGQKEAFQAAMSGKPLPVSLKALLDTIILQTEGLARPAFYLIPPGNERLQHIVGMPDEYTKDINDFPVGPQSIACGLAMHKGEPVITSDVEVDPQWESLRALTRKHHCRAYWSFPVRTPDGPILGTLGIYFSEPREPTARELELAGILTHAAAIIISREQELIERTQVEKALRRSEKKLKRLVRLRDELIANASHELNTPLTSIIIYAKILEKSLKNVENSSQNEIVTKLKVQIEHLRVLIRDMLDNTSLVEGKLQLTISRFNLNQLIQQKVEDMQFITKKNTFKIDCESIAEIEADQERIGQVITNLISNAIKYSPQGGEIIISNQLMDSFIKISVTDHGIGIPREDLHKIFERFYRGHANNSFSGMGIGLSICKDIIDMHRGKLEVESQEGIGSTFSFIIPIRHKELIE